ncbi:alpha/beta fold hydrolase [Ascidiimonas sp. W6]|uniref:alpha/beta fold hydrolase n=1 Tax=Ascidiimonas meishanensis TaxID=3128903 RepID=UPI0030EB58F4
MKFRLLFFILSILLIGCKSTKEITKPFVPTFTISKETTHKIPEGQVYTFGYLEVLENRFKPNGNKIQLPVYIFKSSNKNPKKDPIIYTVGGPGYSTMRTAQYMKYYTYLDDRDFILFEQRGTQYAQPSLDCPEWSKAIYLSQLPGYRGKKEDSLLNDAVLKCKTRLLKKGIDLNAYNTHEIASDIEDLRKVLKIEQYNLLTISYSTKIAQVLLRDFPQAIRSVVMDSPLPLEVTYDEVSVENLLDVAAKLLSDCELDEKCNKAFPNIKKRFFTYLKEKTENPLLVEIENPTNGNLETFYLKGKDLMSVFTSASTGSIANVPFELEKLLNNDLSTLKEELLSIFKKPAAYNGYGMGMRLSVWCAEEYPFASQKTIESESKKHPQTKGLSPAVFESNICKLWDVKKVGSIENKAVISNKPVLLISGAYDYETPLKWANAMQKNLPNSFHLIFKGWTHTPTTYWSNPCAMEAANVFFNHPEKLPNLECLKNLKPPKFKTD